jgi:hypothetical protein
MASCVVARNLATSIETKSVTNSSGNYYISLPPGDYSVSISHQGFSTSVVPKLTLTVEVLAFSASLREYS